MRLFPRLLTLAACGLLFAPSLFADEVVYDSIPGALPGNLPSEAFEAQSVSEFGELIEFGGGNSSYSLTSATVLMSDWALESTWASEINGSTITTAGFYVPITLDIYSVGSGDTVGTLIAGVTVDAFIPWRPESSGCSDSTAYRAADGNCYHGSLSEVIFDLGGMTVPDGVIYSVSFNTTDYGTEPTGVAGPYDSLNFALSSTGDSVGSNPAAGSAYLSSTRGDAYSDNGAGGTGVFREDSNWASYEGNGAYEGAIEFDAAAATPEPSSLLLAATGLCALACRFRSGRKRIS